MASGGQLCINIGHGYITIKFTLKLCFHLPTQNYVYYHRGNMFLHEDVVLLHVHVLPSPTNPLHTHQFYLVCACRIHLCFQGCWCWCALPTLLTSKDWTELEVLRFEPQSQSQKWRPLDYLTTWPRPSPPLPSLLPENKYFNQRC